MKYDRRLRDTIQLAIASMTFVHAEKIKVKGQYNSENCLVEKVHKLLRSHNTLKKDLLTV